MEIFAISWGLTLNQTILLIAAILIVIDFFIPSDIPTHIAYILLCVFVAVNIHYHILIKILFALLAWFVLVFFHYLFWRSIVQKIIDKYIAPDRFKSGVEGIVGNEGTIRILDGAKMVKVKGDLWHCRGADNMEDGTKVRIIDVENGILNVKQIERNT